MYAGISEAQHQNPAVLQWGLLKVSQGIMHFLLGNSLHEKSLLSKVAAGSHQAILRNVMLCSVMIKTCDFQPTSLRKSSDNRMVDLPPLKAACGDIFGNGQNNCEDAGGARMTSRTGSSTSSSGSQSQ